jgi:hypothetical protein
MARRVVIVNDRMQQGYRYELTAPTGRDYATGFEPELTPPQMEVGVFCGSMTDTRDEFPANWFTRAGWPTALRAELLQRRASQLWVWRAKADPSGRPTWLVQWYCRYYMGWRISAEDHRQISRGKRCAGTSGRSTGI